MVLMLSHFARSLTNYCRMLLAVQNELPERGLAESTVAMYRRLTAVDGSYHASLAEALLLLAELEIRELLPPPASLGPSSYESITLADEAVAIYRSLAQTEPTTFADLALALYVLCAARFGAGRKQDALQAMEESVEIYRWLAQTEPTYARRLAVALGGLANLQADCLDLENSVASAKEAASTYEQLADSDSAYLAQYIESLEHLWRTICTAGKVDKVEALPEAMRAVAVYRRLAIAEPAAYSPRLIIWLCHVVIPAIRAGDRDGGVATYSEAFDIYRRLALTGDAVTSPDLAEAANDLTILSIDLKATSVGPTLGAEQRHCKVGCDGCRWMRVTKAIQFGWWPFRLRP